MITVHVHVHVKDDCITDFLNASRANAEASRQEPGIAQFAVFQQSDVPARFLLIEAYRTAEDPARHKETAHYAAWRDAVAEMMAEPRCSVRYDDVSP